MKTTLTCLVIMEFFDMDGYISHIFSSSWGFNWSYTEFSERKKNREGMLRTLGEQHEFNMVLNNEYRKIIIYVIPQGSNVEVLAIVNDTTGTMMSCAFKNPSVSAGLILGTGTNACYMEYLDNVPKWDGDRDEPRQVIINTEWGAFGDNGSLNHVQTKYDEQVDKNSLNPGMQL